MTLGIPRGSSSSSGADGAQRGGPGGHSAAAAQDGSRFGEADLAFHQNFSAVAGHGRLEAFWNQYHPTFAALFDTSIRGVRDFDRSVAEHVVLFDHVIAGRDEEGKAELRAHLERARRAILEVQRESLRRSAAAERTRSEPD